MWRKVDELPIPYTDILLTDGVHIDTGHYSDTFQKFYWNGVQFNEPTHWIKSSDLFVLPGFGNEEDIESCVESIVADVTQLEDAVIGIGQAGHEPDVRDMALIRLTHLVLVITNKLYPGMSNYEGINNG